MGLSKCRPWSWLLFKLLHYKIQKVPKDSFLVGSNHFGSQNHYSCHSFYLSKASMQISNIWKVFTHFYRISQLKSGFVSMNPLLLTAPNQARSRPIIILRFVVLLDLSSRHNKSRLKLLRWNDELFAIDQSDKPIKEWTLLSP